MNIVEAVTKSEIDQVHGVLVRKYGQIYGDIWKVGVNVALRIGDLLSITHNDININKRLLVIIESKTGKKKEIRLNEPALTVINRRRKEYPNDTWLFQVRCNRAKNKPICRKSVGKVFKETGDILGLNINTHSMRKSRGKAMFEAGVPVEKIARVLNHSDPRETLRYIGITREDELRTYDEFEL